MGPRDNSEVVIVAPRMAAVRECSMGVISPEGIRVRTLLSGISHGTEMAKYRGTFPFATQEFDPGRRLFVPRAGDRPCYPLALGYEVVGEVEEVGDSVDGLAPGDLVHAFAPHRKVNVVPCDRVTKLPPGMEPRDGVFIALAGVALHAVHDARVKLGDAVAVFGLGTIGLLAIQQARLAGASLVLGSDPIEGRRALGMELGADAALDPTQVDVGLEIHTANGNRGMDSALETSGVYAALHDALRSVGMCGTVVAAGFYQGEAVGLRLGEEWHHNRLNLVSSMGVWGCPHRDHPLWDHRRVIDAAVCLLADKRLRVQGLVSCEVPFESAPEAYRLIDRHPDEVLKVVLTYGT